MDERRAVLKLGLVAIGNVLLAPFRALFGAGPVPKGRLSLSEDKVVRAFYAEGWNGRNAAVLASHPATAQQCQKQFERYRAAFPDLRIDVNSVEKVGDLVHVRWSAQGTHRGTLDGRQATGRKANVQGLTKMKIVDGKIVSADAQWDQAGLNSQLGSKAAG